MKFAVKSDRGMVREINEDCFNIISGYSGVPETFIIADGMGGHNSGELASRMAVDYASSYIIKFSELSLDEQSIPEIIQDIIEKTNMDVYKKSREEISNHGMGTTFIIAVIFHGKLFVGHIGDSRVYRIGNSTIKQITTDHSLIEELIQNGSLSRNEAHNHPKKNVITRALGYAEYIQSDIYSCDIIDNDYVILCSDGLTNMLKEDEILAVTQEKGEPEAICGELINRANRNGGGDNITVIVVKNDDSTAKVAIPSLN